MKRNIALVTGGYSGEAVISYKSATTIYNNLDKEKYNVFKIDITKNGWFFGSENGSKSEVNKNDFTIIENGEKVNFDAVLIAMHGTPGEDGKLQGYFDMLNIPYTGCSAVTSALTMNKSYTTSVAGKAGVNVASSVLLFDHSPVSSDEILQKLKLPLFVKPNSGGSSIGMGKVEKAEDLQQAIDRAFQEDTQVLVEEMIVGREFTIGVYKTKGEIVALPITEIVAEETQGFFDYVAKYEGKSQEITPAVVDASVTEKIQNAARRVYSVFNCNGVVRIDFIYNEAVGAPFMLEVNTIPGQSAVSLVPQQVAASGSNLKDFYTLLVEECFR